jgi:omega-6 fatty acid desaturase (delta-12 desaturase)
MLWFQIFQDGPEYEARKKRGTFSPPNLSLKQLHEVVPRRLHERSTAKSLAYLLRHLAITYVFFYLATFINPITLSGTKLYPQLAFFFRQIVHPLLWLLYWGWQGVTFAGIWCLGMSSQ